MVGAGTLAGTPSQHAAPPEFLWWQRGLIYQVYPRSFQDSDADGVGDLPGITSRLDYLRWLGVDALWLSPIYPSPMADFGYDISDYTAIHPIFGTMEDFDRLLAEAHLRDIRVIMDYVPNHTSDQHPWFVESRSSRDNPKRDWYIWKDAAPGGGPPNNWLGHFGGTGWEWDETTGQYYYHAFLPEQPDLNWRNPDVQCAMLEVMRFWLDKGVDGFRVDVLWHVIKDDKFRDDPPNPDHVPSLGPYSALDHVYSTDRPEVHEVVQMMRRTLDEYGGGERIMIGELYLPLERLMSYYGVNGDGAHLPFNFHLIRLPWTAGVVKQAVDSYENALPAGGWPNWVLGNHDRQRIVSRIGLAQARVAAMMLLTLRGTPTLYYGDEIGMPDVPIPPDKVQDPYERNVPGLGLGRDPCRTPMQWDGCANAGFTDGEPWLPISHDFATQNVDGELEDRRSTLKLHQRLIELRRSQPALSVGDYVPLELAEDVFAYIRRYDDVRFLTALNFSHETRAFPLRALRGCLEISTMLDGEGDEVGDALQLRGNEGVVIRLA